MPHENGEKRVVVPFEQQQMHETDLYPFQQSAVDFAALLKKRALLHMKEYNFRNPFNDEI